MSFAQDLRASVLQAAMQGKLTEQLETDTTVEEMFNNYNVKLSAIEDDVPFDISEHWRWVSHNDIFSIIGGSQPAKSYFSETQKDGYVRLYQIRDYGTHPVPIFVDKKLKHNGNHKHAEQNDADDKERFTGLPSAFSFT